MSKTKQMAAERGASGAPKFRELDEAETEFLTTSGFKHLNEGIWFTEERVIHTCQGPLDNPWFGEVEFKNKNKNLVCVCCGADFIEMKDAVAVLRKLGGN